MKRAADFPLVRETDWWQEVETELERRLEVWKGRALTAKTWEEARRSQAGYAECRDILNLLRTEESL